MSNILKVSNPIQVQKNANKYLNNNTKVEISDKKNKKYKLLNPETNKYIYFGDSNYEDFTKHKDLERRSRYLKRASNIKGNWKNNKYSPNNLSINLLW